MSSNTFTNIETAFTEYFSGMIFNSELEKRIGSLLSHHKFVNDDIKFKVYIVNYGNEPYRGMSVIPLTLGGLSEALSGTGDNELPSYTELYKRWRTIPEWAIEIDERLFDKSYIQLNPRELTAMLIHEIGHTIFSDKKFEAFYRMYREVRLKYTITQRTKLKYVSFILYIPLMVAASVHTILIGKNGIREEKFCDELTIKYGYANDLISVFNKLIAYYGSTAFKNPSAAEDKIAQEIIWSFNTVADITVRKRNLNTQLTLRALKSKSPTLKDTYMNLVKRFGTVIRERKTGIAFESLDDAFRAIEESDAPVLENFIIEKDSKSTVNLETLLMRTEKLPAYEGLIMSDKNKTEKELKRLKVTDYDIDIIFVEIEKIQNPYDKVFTLDLIYNISEKLDVLEDMSEYDDSIKRKYLPKIKGWREKLAIARNKCLNKDISEKQYGLYVPVPKGYEG